MILLLILIDVFVQNYLVRFINGVDGILAQVLNGCLCEVGDSFFEPSAPLGYFKFLCSGWPAP